MFLQVITIVAIFGNLESKPIIVRNISDCSITEDGILHYQGKHSFTKFQHECLLWSDMQSIYAEIINDENFFNDKSVKLAKNYCRNPNMNINGPWCFVQNGDAISMEACGVCQSLAPRPTLPTNFGVADDVTVVATNDGIFDNIRDEIKRYGNYLREKVLEIFDRVKQRMIQLGTKFSSRFSTN